ncbi:uncharacterized protein LOC131438348 isoform X2 [Malaya genurostris]|uniref:uncharacterized protein LOC131438348 isoform X2 n=1 Tax=Malaya genurostris TaxID=325434 RepID=UPI0026F3DBF0|nr:uncharacterized protein LOC131438348 isoform X2 [Malaya genurostris]
MNSRARSALCLLLVCITLINGTDSTIGEPLNSTTVSDVENSIESSKKSVTNSTESVNLTDMYTSFPSAVHTSDAVVITTQETTEPTTAVITTSTTTLTMTSTIKTVAAPSISSDEGFSSIPDKSPNCSQFPLSPHQPVYDKDSLINKCCPFGEIFEPAGDGRFRCTSGQRTLDVETIYAVFYGNSECIEDKENKLHFNYQPNDSCFGNNLTFQYSREQGDQLFVIQNGSLLVLEEGGFMSVFDWYCVEVDTESRLLAKACDEVKPIILRTTAVLIYIGMVIASLTLLFTCAAYALVPMLNDTFGYLLAGHTGAFLVGLILMTLAVCGDRCIEQSNVDVLQIFAQIFLMSSIYAFVFMNVFNYACAAYYIPNGLKFDTKNKRDVFVYIGFLMFHLILYIYYLVTAVVLYLSHQTIRSLADSKFVRFTVSQQNYNELTYTEAVNAQPQINGERLKDVRGLNRLCTIEAIFTLVCWIIFSSLQRSIDSQHDIFRIGCAYAIIFQGMLIGVLFVGGRKKWTIIRECWNNSGSIDLRAMEMEREMLTLDRKTPLS